MLPNREQAMVALEKLTGYCLDQTHLRGQHKARVFQAALGITVAEADVLREALLVAARTMPATVQRADAHGQRYVIDFSMEHRRRKAVVGSAWIVREDGVPRLTTCHVLEERRA